MTEMRRYILGAVHPKRGKRGDVIVAHAVCQACKRPYREDFGCQPCARAKAWLPRSWSPRAVQPCSCPECTAEAQRRARRLAEKQAEEAR